MELYGLRARPPCWSRDKCGIGVGLEDLRCGWLQKHDAETKDPSTGGIFRKYYLKWQLGVAGVQSFLA